MVNSLIYFISKIVHDIIENVVTQGDSGGPMTVGSTVYGVTSWGVNGCGTNFPSVYAKVGPFQSWVCGESNNEPVGC